MGDDFDMASSPPASALRQSIASLSPSTSTATHEGSTAPVRFPSSFADFKLSSTAHSSFSFTAPAPLSGSHMPSFSAGSPTAGSPLTTNGDGLDNSYSLFRKGRRPSTLAVTRPYGASDMGGDDGALSASVPPPQHHHAFGSQHANPSPTSHSFPPSTSTHGSSIPRPHTPENWSYSPRPSMNGTSPAGGPEMAVSPAKVSLATRSASPPLLNPPPSFSGEAAFVGRPSPLMGGRLGDLKGKGKEVLEMDESSSSSEEGGREGLVSRPITRRGSLLPKPKSHLLTAQLLAVESHPSASEIRSEAQIQRLLASQSTSPLPKPRSHLSSAAAYRSTRGRFPEDADGEEDDIFGFAGGSGMDSDSSGEDADGAMDDERSVAATDDGDIGSLPSQSLARASFGSLGGFGISTRSPRPSMLDPHPIALSSALSSLNASQQQRPSSREGSAGPSAMDASMIASSPVMGSPAMGFANGPGTPGSFGAGAWRDSGKSGNKRKAADDRFEPYHASLKRRAVSPSTVLFPSGTPAVQPMSTAASSLHQSSSASSSSSAGSFSASAARAPVTDPPSSHHSFAQSPTTSSTLVSSSSPFAFPAPPTFGSALPAPIPIAHPSASFGHTTSRSSRPGSPVLQQIQLSTSAGRMSGSGPGYAGAGLGLSLLQREREERRRGAFGGGASMTGSGAQGDGEMERMRLGE